MSDEVQEETSVENGGREVLVRTFAVESQSLDGRTLSVRVVPFNEVATVADPPDFRPYREQFVRGAFKAQENAAHRIRLRAIHDEEVLATGKRGSPMASVVGKGVSLREEDGGYEADFRFLNTPEADTALELTREGGYDGVSAEFIPIRTVRTKDGIMSRVKAHLDSVALALGPAYTGAEILALREGHQIVEDEEMMLPPVNQALLERCVKLGIDLPEGMAKLLTRAYTEAPWDGSASRFDTAESYCSASAIDSNPSGEPKQKNLCHLPYKEPSGEINVNGVRAALSEIGKGNPQDATPAERDGAKSKLEKILASFTSSSTGQ
jgi:HK97 family phage prohead protease